MHRRSFIAVIVAFSVAPAFAALGVAPVAAESVPAPAPAAPSSGAPSSSLRAPTPAAATQAAPSPPSVAPTPNTVNATQPPDPVIAAIRTKLADPALRQGATSDDLAALKSFYGERSGPPVWTTSMGFTAKGQAVIDEIADADNWGLPAAAFDLPASGALTATPEAQAAAEIKLDLAILKYARFARGGRIDPSSISDLMDLAPTLKDPKLVLNEIASAEAPDAYLHTLHPQHEQFERLRQALLKARGDGDADSNGKSQRNQRDIERILINMERWRWMPPDLGKVYVQDNVPEFMLYVVKDGKPIHSDKIVVGEMSYATPIFSADMQTIVFNPEWTVPPTIVRENLLPNLRGGWFGSGTSILREHGLQVRYNGRIVDPGSINWSSVNMANIAFTQPPGPDNVLGKIKFLYPNKHTVYMHDTIKHELFQLNVRAKGHNCIRMEHPGTLAQVLLAEDKGWEKQKVDDLLDKGNNTSVNLDHPIPVHTTYFTAVVGDDGKLKSFADIYGLDRKLAPALLGKPMAYAVADTAQAAQPDPAQPKTPDQPAAHQTPSKPPKDAIAAGDIQGLFGD